MSTDSDTAPLSAKTCIKTLQEQIDVVAEFHAHNIQPERIAYRTGIPLQLVQELVHGESHQRQFKQRLAAHRRARRDQRLRRSRRIQGIAQAELQESIEREYQQTLKSS